MSTPLSNVLRHPNGRPVSTQGTPSGDETRRWLDLQRQARGEEAPNDTSGAFGAAHDRAAEQQHSQSSLIEAGLEVLHAPKIIFAGGRRVLLKEPTLAQVRRFLSGLKLVELVAMGQKARGTNGVGNASVDEIKGATTLLPEFERLLLESLEFVDADVLPPPQDLKQWFDGLAISEALRLLDVFSDAVDFDTLVQHGRSLMGKLQRVRAHVRPPVARG